MNTLKKYWWLWLIIVLLLVWRFWPKGAAAKKTTGNGEKEKMQAEYNTLAAQRVELLKPYVARGQRVLPDDVRAKLKDMDARMNELGKVLFKDVIYTSNYQTNISPMWWL